MHAKYIKKRNIAVAVYLAGLVIVGMGTKVFGMDQDSVVCNLLALITGGSLIAACWFYLKAKNRSELLPLSIIAFFIYWMLEDHSNLPAEVSCPKCGKGNFPSDKKCRLCAATFDMSFAEMESK